MPYPGVWGGCERVLDVWQEGSFQLGPVEMSVEPQAPEIQGCWCWAPICLCFCDRLSVAARSGIDDLPGGRVNVCLSVSRRRRQFMQTPCPYPTQEPPWLTDSSKLSSSRTALAIALTTADWDKTLQVLCPSRICQVSSLDCESVLDRLTTSSPTCSALSCPVLPCHRT